MGLLSRLLGTRGGTGALVADLHEAHGAELGLALTLRAHAERARYPQLAARLEELAAIEERHAAWLAEELRRLGQEPPAALPTDAPGDSPWARACAVRQVAQRKRRRLVELLTRWDPDAGAVVDVLRRIAREDAAQLSVLQDVVVRSDPHARD
jgi:rubrerythrin